MGHFMFMMRIALIAALIASPLALAQVAPDFDREIAPLFVQRCLDCHGGSSPKGKLDLSRRESAMAGGEDGKVIVPGHLDQSPMWELIDNGKMPPKKGLPPAERELIKRWIAAGAHWGSNPIDPFSRSSDRRAGRDWWSLQTVMRPELPIAKRGGWAKNSIDVFVLAAMETKGLMPSDEAPRRLLIRRIYFDLIGLPPTPGEVDAFVADTSSDAYERVVDRLLASPQYGVRWARHWLDIARFGESNGFEHDEFRPNAWPYRDWVVSALNTDLPFDQFARLQIAGDVLRPDSADAIAATGFLVAGAYDSVGQTQQSQAMRKVVRQDELEDVTGTLGQTFLGLTVQCARCHDHKFDPIRQKEYYRLTAALAGVHPGERELPACEAGFAETRRHLERASAELADLEKPIRTKILSHRDSRQAPTIKAVARWDFRQGLNDMVGGLNARVVGKAQLGKAGLILNGKDAYAVAGPLPRELRAKTLEAWVKLDSLDQKGGSAISIQTAGGGAFDAIVFGEKEPARWMAGSDFYVRTKSFAAAPETDATRQFVQIAIVYSEDGSIAAYRNGKPYGQTYNTALLAFKAGETQILFGLRHSPAGGDRLLAGVIERAALYDRALSPDEIAASAGAGADFVTSEEIAAALSPKEAAPRQSLIDSIGNDRKILSAPKPRSYAVTPSPPEKVYLLTRGNTAQPAGEVAAGGVAAVVGVQPEFGLATDSPDSQRRIALANWITNPKNPLFTRVIVNRLWHYHFGVGVVETPNDFGFNGGRPSHPQLLDYLASELVEQKFSLKAMHRLIVTSATYRQSSHSNEHAIAIDANNRLLWRKSPRRMEAETVRDTVLTLAGQLNPALGGPGFMEYSVKAAPGTTTNTYTPVDAVGEQFNRRTLYRAWARGGRSGLLDALDCPDPSVTAPARSVTNTPLQALAMLNNATILRSADAFARRLDRQADGIDAKIVLAYRFAYGRAPSANEQSLARRAVETHGLSVLTRALFNSNEFLFVE